jgi:hypothetical protein
MHHDKSLRLLMQHMGGIMWKFTTSMLSLVLAACAAPYGPSGGITNFLVHGGYGYSDRQLDDKTWEVTYSGHLADRQYVFNAAIRRSAEIAKKGGFPYFTAADVKNDSVRYTDFSGSHYYGTSAFVTVRVQGWKARDERCEAGKVLRSLLPCDLYDTEETLASWETQAERAKRQSRR